jgi:peptidoglycan/xylan/chitin deacetylase (PgdA/CDA1 family)
MNFMDQTYQPVRTYAEFTNHYSALQKLRTVLRNAVVTGRSVARSIRRQPGNIAFPYYHHIFDDERRPFERQLDFLRGFGEFISLGDAVKMLTAGDTIDGQYFCITFDDGFKNVLTNALPIMTDKGAPLAIFVPTQFIGTSLDTDLDLLQTFFDHGQTVIEFLTWDDLRTMAAAGVTIGSHTVHHARLADIAQAAAEREMVESKKKIETELSAPCDHFSSPFGQPYSDFNPGVHPVLAHKTGYRSFSSTERGVNIESDPYAVLKRDHTVAKWSTAQLQYFLGA